MMQPFGVKTERHEWNYTTLIIFTSKTRKVQYIIYDTDFPETIEERKEIAIALLNMKLRNNYG